MSVKPGFIQLDSIAGSVVIDCCHSCPAVLYWGKRLTVTHAGDSRQNNTAAMLALLATRQEAKCSAVVEAPLALSPLLGQGFTGAPGIEISVNTTNA